MDRLDCPHCGRPAISAWRRMWLGPAVPAKCQACGKKVWVSYRSMVAIIPFVAAIVAAAFIGPWELKLALWFGGYIVMTYIHLRFPLEPR